jgi:MFS family permease
MRFDRSLLTSSHLPIFGVTLLGFLAEYVLRPVIPLIILDRGGGAALIGLVTGVFALPSIGLRPVVGWLVDRWRQRRILGLGTVLSSISPAGLLLPGIAPIVAARFVQGSAWALFTVSTRTLMAQATPAGRRAEASAYFAAMPAVALLVAPGIGVALYLATGAIGPIIVATILALATLLAVARLPGALMPQPGELATRQGGRFLAWFVEPSVFPAMAMTGAFMAADTLFSVFPPVFLALVGGRIETLAIYYPAYGLVSAVSLFVVGRISDRLDRGAAIRLGGGFAVVGLAVAILADGFTVFGLGAAIYAIGASFASAALGALSIDQAPPHRLGSAMATYSIGFQLAIGGSGVIWGPLIGAYGFDVALGGALLLVLAVAAASYRYAGPSSDRPTVVR